MYMLLTDNDMCVYIESRREAEIKEFIMLHTTGFDSKLQTFVRV